MPFDAHKNLAVATVATAPSPATSGTTLVVAAGQGARFPAAPFNATVWPATDLPTPATAEVVRVTARTTDTLTITRAQEGTTARTIVAGDLIAATITAKTITDVESGTNFPALTTAGLGTFGGVRVIGAVAGGVGAGVEVFTAADQGYLQAYDRTLAAYLPLNLCGSAIPFVVGPTGASAERGRMHPSGGLSWGHTTDPGPGRLSVGGAGGTFPAKMAARFNPDLGETGVAVGITADSPGGILVAFWSAGNTLIGSIGVTSGPGVAYNTTSDARLKTDRGRHADPGVLRETVVHDFTWTADGTPGRGVFAQEAAAVAPFAVTVGGDERDADGRLVQPWGVDYAKYVPDLIVGWQAHEAQVVALTAQVATLEARLAALEAALAARD